jgi:DNA-binding transcriptional LysR family regulator
MNDLNDFYYFVQVVDHKGFAPAARALGLQKSLLSRRIAVLEAGLGARLLQRSSRHFVVTEIGQAFYERCAAMLTEARSAELVVAASQAAPCGTVRLSCPVGLLSFQFAPMLARFMSANPAVRLHLDSTNRRVDVIAEGFDLAIRVRFPPLDDSDLVVRQLDESTQCLVAHPRLTRHDVATPADLSSLPSIGHWPPQRDFAWELWDSDGQSASVPYQPRLVTADLAVLHEGALQGLGVAQLPTIMVEDDFRQGRLVRLLPDWRPKSGIVHAVFPSRRGLLPSVRALLDFLAAECAAKRAIMAKAG